MSDFEDLWENAVTRFAGAHPDEKNWEFDWKSVQSRDYEITLSGPLGSKSIHVAKGLGGMTGCILEALESLRNAIVSPPAQDLTVTSPN